MLPFRIIRLVVLCLILNGISPSVLAQDFRLCQELLQKVLPVFNRAFEENNPGILRNPEYRRNVLELEKAYRTYHVNYYLPEDSLRRANNEAILTALYGSFSKSLHLITAYGPVGGDAKMVYNTGLINLLNDQNSAARSEFSRSNNLASSSLNTLVSFAREGKVEDARTLLQAGTGTNPDGKWNYNSGMIHKMSGDDEGALSEFSAALKHKDWLAYRLQRGDLLMNLGEDKKAVSDFEKVMSLHPKAQIRYANALLSLRKFAEAKSIFEKYMEGTDRQFRAYAYLGMGHSYYGLQKMNEAKRYYTLASKSSITEFTAKCGLGNVMLSQHYYSFAKNIFDRLIQNDPSYLSAYLGRAIAHFGLKNYPAALADFKVADTLVNAENKFLADVFVSRGYSHYYSGDGAKAWTDFDTALKMDPARFEALAGKSSILIDQKKYSEAGNFLNAALNYEKGNDQMWSNYGNLLLHFDMYQKSREVFKKALRLNPTNVKAQNGWAVGLLESDQMDKALVLFDSLIKRNPHVPYLYNNRGIVQAYHGNRYEQEGDNKLSDSRYRMAFQDFKVAMEKAPTRKFYNVNQGNVYRYWQKYEDAKLSYESYQDKSAINNTGVMYASMRNEKNARYYLDVALKLDSVHRVFKYNMAVLMKGKSGRASNAVASVGSRAAYSDIGIKYSLDGFVTIYLYDYEYDPLNFKGRHYLPLPVGKFGEDYMIPHYDFEFLEYNLKEVPKTKKKSGKLKSQKVNMGGSRRSGTDCPVL